MVLRGVEELLQGGASDEVMTPKGEIFWFGRDLIP